MENYEFALEFGQWLEEGYQTGPTWKEIKQSFAIQDKEFIKAQMMRDGLPQPRIATKLRYWAMHREDVLRVTLKLSRQRYILSAMLTEPLIEKIQSAYQELGDIAPLFHPFTLDRYVVTTEQRDSILFNGRTYDIYEETNF